MDATNRNPIELAVIKNGRNCYYTRQLTANTKKILQLKKEKKFGNMPVARIKFG